MECDNTLPFNILLKWVSESMQTICTWTKWMENCAGYLIDIYIVYISWTTCTSSQQKVILFCSHVFKNYPNLLVLQLCMCAVAVTDCGIW